jgi:HSP20 family molecular chaperone IbpA
MSAQITEKTPIISNSPPSCSGRIGLNSCKNFSLTHKISKYCDYTVGGPSMNMYENLSEVVIEVEMIGLKLEDIQLDFNHSNEVIVAGEAKKNPKFEGYQVLIDERPQYKFERKISFTPHADVDQRRIELVDGLLTITIPKKIDATSA